MKLHYVDYAWNAMRKQHLRRPVNVHFPGDQSTQVQAANKLVALLASGFKECFVRAFVNPASMAPISGICLSTPSMPLVVSGQFSQVMSWRLGKINETVLGRFAEPIPRGQYQIVEKGLSLC